MENEPKVEVEVEEAKKDGVQDETTERSESVNSFIVEHFFSRGGKDTKYDSMTELHLAGGSYDDLQEVANGSARPSSVDVIYEKGRITNIHVIYHSEGGLNNDFYLSGKALEDYLSGE